MLKSLQRIRRLLKDESGPTAVEYAVMLALIVIVCLAAIKTVGTNAKTTFSNVAASIAGTGS
jgi:pilus assembly protein Flp/PilA